MKLTCLPAAFTVQSLSEERMAKLTKRLKEIEPYFEEDVKILDLVNKDHETLEKMGITISQILDQVDAVIGMAHRHFALYRKQKMLVKTRGREYHVKIHNTGCQKCPFRLGTNVEERTHHNCALTINAWCAYSITEAKSKMTLVFRAVLMHMIRDHQFFGYNKDLRLNPEDLVTLFDLKPKVDYKSPTVEIAEWELVKSEAYDEALINTLNEKKICHFHLNEGKTITCFFLPSSFLKHAPSLQDLEDNSKPLDAMIMVSDPESAGKILTNLKLNDGLLTHHITEKACSFFTITKKKCHAYSFINDMSIQLDT